MEDQKKLAAILAAVSLYIQSEEEAAMRPPQPREEPAPVPVSLWGISGRQSMMQLRNLMQLRSFHGARLR